MNGQQVALQLLRGRSLWKINIKFVRYKHQKDHWSVVRKRVPASRKALEHFDDFYQDVYQKEWTSIRFALLRMHKYVAVINNYGDSEETKEMLENSGCLNMRVLFDLERGYIEEELAKDRRMKDLSRIRRMADQNEAGKFEIANNDGDASGARKKLSLESSLKAAELDESRLIDPDNSVSNATLYEFVPASDVMGMSDFVPESQHYKYYDNTFLPVEIETEYTLNFPKTLDIYSYERDNPTGFVPPKPGSTGVMNYYLMDGGSVLPVLALDVRPGNRVLDMCAAPGGKSLIALQTLCPDFLLANDSTPSRVGKIKRVFKMYLYDFEEKWLKTDKIRISVSDGRYLKEDNFDRIIVDVPCTTDRHSVYEGDNNIFKADRIKERLKLPEMQSELLENGLKMLNIGGILVYSTCSLSPIQNDGVVHMALKKIYERTSMKFVIKDLSPALLQARCLYKFAHNKLLKYGHLVVPYEPLNFGPTYFCKIQRIC